MTMDPSITSYPMMAPLGTIGGSHISVTVVKVLPICSSTDTGPGTAMKASSNASISICETVNKSMLIFC